MIELTLPGSGTLQLEGLVCDVNGTLAVDGSRIDGLARALYRITVDTHRRQDAIYRQLNLRAVRAQPGGEAEQKAT